MKTQKELEEMLKIGFPIMYDFEGKGDFRWKRIESIIEKDSIKYLIFCNTTGKWPVDAKLIKRLDEVGIGNYY